MPIGGRSFRAVRGRVTALIACAVVATSSGALAGKKDDEAKKLVQEAMEDDYLATNMTTAVAKLQNALKICEGHCDKATLAKIHGALGTVYAAGLSAHEDAVAAFKKMLEADPKAAPASAYLTGDVQKDFDRAKAERGGSAEPSGKPEGPVGVLEEHPWAEQATYHPVPIHVKAPEGVTISRVVARYRGPGQADWKEVTLNKVAGGFGGYVPCGAVEKTGTLSYFVTAFDANLDRVASAGSAEQPRKVELKGSISGRQPALPGAVPPEQCPRPEQGLSCETDADCPGNRACVNLMCVDEASVVRPDDAANKARKLNWLSLAYSLDLTVVSSTDDACSASAQQDGKLSCFYKDGVQYDGAPIQGDGNTLKGGIGVGSMRVLVGYDRVLAKRITLGLRAGFAFLGTPERTDGEKFLPFHGEVRGAYFFSSDPFVTKGVRPYLFGGGGVGQVSARMKTEVREDDGAGGLVNRTLEVHRTSGPFFGGLGVGVQYAVSPEAAMVIEVAGRAMFPDFAPVIAPSLGFAYGL